MGLFVQSKNETQIAKELGIPRKNVVEHIKEWRESAQGSTFMKERVTDLLALFDEHNSRIIAEYYKIVKEVNDALAGADTKEVASLLGQKNQALSKILDSEAKRIDVLQKAGLLEAADLGDQFADQEAKQQQLMDILREVSYDCSRCKMEVANRLAAITGKAEVIPDNESIHVKAEVVH